MWTYEYSDELQHWGIKGMKWGIRRYQNEDGSLTPAGKERLKQFVSQERSKINTNYAKTGNKLSSKSKGDILTRKTGIYDNPMERKKRIDADIKEADDRVKFYGSKRAAKAAIQDEAEYKKLVNRGEALTKTMFGVGGGLGAMVVTGAATSSTALALTTGLGIPIGVGLVSVAAAKKANDFINRHAKDQILYTNESEYGHDVVVAFKKYDKE